ncbi:MAG: type I restriction endonuclease subunit R, partial [Myxococcales bacterium]|nr:type I restriction endonuclease subunit R [Myxococcales bacterium]
MSEYTEASLVERPIIKALRAQEYDYVPPSQHAALRGAPNEVLFKPHLSAALLKLNPGLSEADAESAVGQLAQITDNATWLARLRGDYSKQVQGQSQKRTLRLLDFDTPANNHFVVTNQLKVHGSKPRIPDIVIYVNGIPLVVIEAKSPLNPKQGAYDAIHQIRSAEAEIPRLFHSNLFNLATNGTNCLYGATGAPPEHWGRWRDPWPRKAEEFGGDPTALALYALLDPARLLDLLAHFVVFETRDTKTIKKICRYQQFRAVNKLVDRVCHGDPRQGLIWHTQGSGKSLTMVFAALKLKFHQGVQHPALTNPNLLVLTDRRDLHSQISATFAACGLPNPTPAGSIQALKGLLAGDAKGRTILSTIFKFHWDEPGLQAKDPKVRKAAQQALAVPSSARWIIMADEAHRTQEKDLGAYLKAILPDAARFGFTGTPVQKNDLNTFQNFSVPGERYLDKYGIDDAVRDGATVPVRYMARQTKWHLHGKELDVLFDQWFANEPEAVVDELRRRGVTQGDLARFPERIRLIALDIWTHFQAHVAPDGFKAQICAIDRLACVEYKQALDAVIAKHLMDEGVAKADAHAQAQAMSVCVYSAGQHDSQKDERLVTWHVASEDVTKTVIPNFQQADHPLKFLIVCNKLLTGFDAPIEQALYLDNPLTDHNLLQAIARTNRRCGATKRDGLVVDYIGVTAKLGKALSAYNAEDVQGALSDVDEL